MAILIMASMAAVNLANGSVKAVRDAKEVSQATWLLQQKMVELETKLETEGEDKGCDEKSEGKFDEPNSRFTWKAACISIDFFLSESASQLMKATGEDDSKQTSENQIIQMILQLASDYLSNAVRELHVEVHWLQNQTKREVTATTHFARYDLPVAIPGVGGGTNPTASPSPSASPSTQTPGGPTS